MAGRNFTAKTLKTGGDNHRTEITLPIGSPLLVRMTRTTANVPAGLTVEAESHVAYSLLRRRLAVPVSNLDALPDVTVTAEDVESAFGGAA